MNLRAWYGLTAGAVALVAGAATARAEVDINFTLDWKFQGPTAAFLVAVDEGYFAEEGLNVSVDAGNGSAGAVTRVASGAYQLGMADINSLVTFLVENPGQDIRAVYMIYDSPPFSVFTLTSSGIESPADMAGRTLGAPVFDASYQLFPAFAHETGIDEAAVERINMDVPLRETMLVTGEVDMISGHYFSSMLDLKAKGVAEEDIRYFLYADYGMDFYGNAVIASGDFIAEHPEAVAAFNRALARGWATVIADPDSAIESVLARDPLVDAELELERLHLALGTNVMTPYVMENGMGDIVAERMESAIDQLAIAYGFTETPTVDDVWTDAFLPDLELRTLAK
ncbi:MAG: ABC transporter substrate-binding protein [Alphaproteobacteria bacterium]